MLIKLFVLIVSYYKINGIISSADLITELLKTNKELVGVIGSIESSNLKEDFTLDEINNKTIILHMNIDDFTTQPSGNSGERIACGIIRLQK